MVAFAGLSVSDDAAGSERQWQGHAAVKGPKWLRMFLLTFCLLGLQMTWSIEMSYAFPYLLSMGVSKALMSLVFVAGPLSGLVVQPIIGVFADRSKSRWGRRRPFMLAGCMISIGALLLLGFTRDFASLLVDTSTGFGESLVIFLATLSIYLLDFSINAVQAMDRALLVDTLPASEQELGNAWAARLMGVGGMIGFFTGYMDLVSWFPLLGRTQLEVLVILGSVSLLGTHIVTSLCVAERVLLHDSSAASHAGFFASMRDIWSNIRTLPLMIRRICLIQFFNWIAWFPILFYSSEWVGEIYTRAQVAEGRSASDPAVISESRRVGSEALFWNSTTSLTATILLPMLLSAAATTLSRRQSGSSYKKKRFDSVIPIQLLRLLTLPYLWAACQLVFAMMMFLTFITNTLWAANCIMTVIGVPSAVSAWAPFSLLGEAIQADTPISEEIFVLEEHAPSNDVEDSAERAALMTSTDEYEAPEANQSSVHLAKDDEEPAPVVLHVEQGSEVAEAELPHRKSNISEKAGIILGIHNISVVIPQFLVNGLAALIFALLEPQRTVLPHDPSSTIASNATIIPLESTDVVAVRDTDSIGVILRIGGFSALVACYFAYKLAKDVG